MFLSARVSQIEAEDLQLICDEANDDIEMNSDDSSSSSESLSFSSSDGSSSDTDEFDPDNIGDVQPSSFIVSTQACQSSPSILDPFLKEPFIKFCKEFQINISIFIFIFNSRI